MSLVLCVWLNVLRLSLVRELRLPSCFFLFVPPHIPYYQAWRTPRDPPSPASPQFRIGTKSLRCPQHLQHHPRLGNIKPRSCWAFFGPISWSYQLWASPGRRRSPDPTTALRDSWHRRANSGHLAWPVPLRTGSNFALPGDKFPSPSFALASAQTIEPGRIFIQVTVPHATIRPVGPWWPRTNEASEARHRR